MELCEDGVVTRGSVGVVAGYPNQGLIDASQDGDEPCRRGIPFDDQQGE